jgi:O-antigen/teichoic acid export membrane protein
MSVYGLGQYEHAWGRGGSFQVEAWLGLVGALVAMGIFGISSAALQRAHDQGISFVLGGCCAVVCISLGWIASSFTSFSGPYLAFTLLVVVSALASLAGRRHTD